MKLGLKSDMLSGILLSWLRLRKLLHGLSSALGRKALKQGVAASIDHAGALGGRGFATVVDVGANRGQFALFARAWFPNARLICFEPQPAPARLFKTIFSGDPQVTLHPVALGTEAGVLDLHIATEDDSSSLLRIGALQEQKFGTRQAGVIAVNVQRLDAVITPQDLVAPALLKIDVQGFELGVLMGAESLLPFFDAAYVEGSYRELYESQALIGEIAEFLGRHGLQQAGFFNLASDEQGEPLQADFLFLRGRGAS